VLHQLFNGGCGVLHGLCLPALIAGFRDFAFLLLFFSQVAFVLLFVGFGFELHPVDLHFLLLGFVETADEGVLLHLLELLLADQPNVVLDFVVDLLVGEVVVGVKTLLVLLHVGDQLYIL
jgi:hypothetical protein